MKNLILKIIPIIAISLLFTEITIAQDKHTITLFVDTENVSMRNIESTCNFGQSSQISNEEFSIFVEKGDTVEWVGKSTSSEEDKVEIKLIEYSNGTNFFETQKLRGSNGIVTAVVKVAEPGTYEKYNIEFKVFRNGKWVRETFPIDPKLRVRSLSMSESVIID